MRTTMIGIWRSGAARAAVLALAGVTAFGLGGCASASSPGADTTAAATGSTASLTLADGWVKAVEDVGTSEDSMTDHSMSPMEHSSSGMSHDEMSAPMSAMFGTLRNDGDAELTVTAGSTSVASMVELHETVKTADGQMQMQRKEGGFVIPAHGAFVLEPGGNHVMLMGLRAPLKNGDSVTVTLETSGGAVTFDVPIRTFTGANETYNPSPSS